MTVYSSLDNSITNILKLSNIVENLFEECMYKDIQNNPLDTHVVVENLDYFLNKAKRLGYLTENTILAINNKGVFYYLTPSELSLYGAKQCNISKFPLLSEFASNRLDTSVSEKVWKADSLSPEAQKLYNLVYSKQKNSMDIEENIKEEPIKEVEPIKEEIISPDSNELIKIDVPLNTTVVVDDEDDGFFFSPTAKVEKQGKGFEKYVVLGVSAFLLLGLGYSVIHQLSTTKDIDKTKVINTDSLSSIFTNSKHTTLVTGLTKDKFLSIKESLSKSDKERYSKELSNVETYFNMDTQLNSIADGNYDTLEDASFYNSLESSLTSITIKSLKARLTEKFTYIYADYKSYLSIIDTLNTYPTDIDTFNKLESQINSLSSYSPKLLENSKDLFKEVKEYQESLGYFSNSLDTESKIVE